MKLLYLFFLCPFFLLAQVQLGETLYGEANHGLGLTVSMSGDGNIVAVGTHTYNSYVKVFNIENNDWNQIGNTLYVPTAWFITLSADGTTLAVGYPFEDNTNNDNYAGSIRVYRFINNSWVQLGNVFYGDTTHDQIGHTNKICLSDDGNLLVLAAWQYLRVYEYNNNQWSQLGDSISSEPNFISGFDVNSNGTVLAISDVLDDTTETNSGAVYIYHYENGSWVETGNSIHGEFEEDRLGKTVKLNAIGDIIAVGAPNSSIPSNLSGKVRVFQNINSDWLPLGDYIYGEFPNDQLGRSISLSADGYTLALGSHLNDQNATDSGHLRVFKYLNDNWTKQGSDIDGDFTEDNFGYSVDISADGTKVVTGAPDNNTNGYRAGLVKVYDFSEEFLSITEKHLLEYMLYPNPTKNQFTVQLNNDNSLEQIEVYTILGELLITSKQTTVNTSNLSTGTYLVKITTAQGTATEKLIIE